MTAAASRSPGDLSHCTLSEREAARSPENTVGSKLDWINQSSLVKRLVNENFASTVGHSLSQGPRRDLAAVVFGASAAALCSRTSSDEWIGSSHSSGGTSQSYCGGPHHELVQWIPPLLSGKSRSPNVLGAFPHCPDECATSAGEETGISPAIYSKVTLWLRLRRVETRLD